MIDYDTGEARASCALVGLVLTPLAIGLAVSGSWWALAPALIGGLAFWSAFEGAG